MTKMFKSLSIKLKGDEKDLTSKPLLKCVMKKFLPAADALLEMMVLHLPSPATAQKYRVSTLYEGPQDDEVSTSSVRVTSADVCVRFSAPWPSVTVIPKVRSCSTCPRWCRPATRAASTPSDASSLVPCEPARRLAAPFSLTAHF